MPEPASHMADLPSLLHVPDLAELLALSENTVRDMLVRGDLPGFKLGGRWHCKRDVLERRLKTLQRKHRSRVAAADALANDRIPRQYHKSVRSYFRQMEADLPGTPSATGAKKE